MCILFIYYVNYDCVVPGIFRHPYFSILKEVVMFNSKLRTLLAIAFCAAIGASAQIFQNTGEYSGCEDSNLKKTSSSNNFCDAEELYLYL